MGRIRILSDQVANQIAAGEVVDRPASVVKELLENSLDAGAERIRVEVEAGGRKLIRIADDGIGMMRDDAHLAFERHATSKLRTSEDLLSIATLGFRGEALPSIASVSRVELTTRTSSEASGTHIEISGGKVQRVEDAGAPTGTVISVRDLFFNTPARRKFLKSEATELAHITALVTHYALAHPAKHFELHAASHAVLITPPVAKPAERVYQIFGKDTLDRLLAFAAESRLERAGLPEPPPWKRPPDYVAPEPGFLRITGFASKPELQKLNRNSIYCFVNQRLVRDRLLMHAVAEAYRNILPQGSFPVVLLFLELPAEEVDVNVHPAKTEVRFRQPNFIHDFVRDSIRGKLSVARPAAAFLQALTTRPSATPGLVPEYSPDLSGSNEVQQAAGRRESGTPPAVNDAEPFLLTGPVAAPFAGRLLFPPEADGAEAASRPANSAPLSSGLAGPAGLPADESSIAVRTGSACSILPAQAFGPDFPEQVPGQPEIPALDGLASLKPLGQLRESFILAVNEEGLWIVDQHVAHERVLFERILRERQVEKVQRQRLLMPLLIDLLPAQMVVFPAIARELERNGFEVEPFGPRTLAVKAAPLGLDGRNLERMLIEVLEQAEGREQAENLETVRTRVAASLACHAAIKVNTPLDGARMEWILAELAKTKHPMSCPHGRPIVLRYSWKDIQRAFQRI